MSIRNTLFRLFNRYVEDTTHHSYRTLVAINGNEDLFAKGTFFQNQLEVNKLKQNAERIHTSTLDSFQLERFNIVKTFEEQGRSNGVQVEDVVLQLDKVEYLQKLKHIEAHASHYPADVVELYRVLGRVHLEEPGAEKDLEALFEKKPWLRKYEAFSLL